jgi:hypothetical protein
VLLPDAIEAHADAVTNIMSPGCSSIPQKPLVAETGTDRETVSEMARYVTDSDVHKTQ